MTQDMPNFGYLPIESKIGVFLKNGDIFVIALLKVIKNLQNFDGWEAVVNPEEPAKCRKFLQKPTRHPVDQLLHCGHLYFTDIHLQIQHTVPFSVWIMNCHYLIAVW